MFLVWPHDWTPPEGNLPSRDTRGSQAHHQVGAFLGSRKCVPRTFFSAYPIARGSECQDFFSDCSVGFNPSHPSIELSHSWLFLPLPESGFFDSPSRHTVCGGQDTRSIFGGSLLSRSRPRAAQKPDLRDNLRACNDRTDSKLCSTHLVFLAQGRRTSSMSQGRGHSNSEWHAKQRSETPVESAG